MRGPIAAICRDMRSAGIKAQEMLFATQKNSTNLRTPWPTKKWQIDSETNDKTSENW